MQKQRQPAASRTGNSPVQTRKSVVKTAPLPLDEASLKRVVGGNGTAPPAPNGNW